MRSDAIVSAIPGAENNAAAANAFLIMPQCSAASDGGYAGWRLRNGDEQLSVVRWLMFHAAMDVRHRFIEVNNVRLHCAEQGEGPTVILLHGFPECWYSWGRQLPALAAAGYHAIAPDMRGYNLSDKPKRGYDIESLVSDVVELARAIAPGDRRVHLVGHDWGGAVAWQVAWRYPSLLHSLTVMNAPHPAAYARYVRRSPGQMLKSSYMLFFQAPWLPEFVLTRKGAAAIASAFRRSTKRAEAFSAADL
ncbi:MAG: alpha/beta fold hydrolase, partial [Dehalococcoidia bacterium]